MIEKTGKSLKSPGVLMPHTTVIDGKGYGGNFTLRIKAGEKVEDLDCAAVIVATGGGWATQGAAR
jgi:thioredoxin reductase